MSALLSLQRVSKRFRGLQAVDAVSFEVSVGELLAIIGPNGAGKTTLFNMIAGAIAPDAGSISFAGEPIGGLPADAICRRGIGRTFQIVRPFPALTVEDNVVVGALLHSRRIENGSKSRARSRPNRNYCCSMRLWPVCVRPRATAWSPPCGPLTATAA